MLTLKSLAPVRHAYRPTQSGCWCGLVQAPPSRIRHVTPLSSTTSCGTGLRGAAIGANVPWYLIRTSTCFSGSRRHSAVDGTAEFQQVTVFIAENPHQRMFGLTAAGETSSPAHMKP